MEGRVTKEQLQLFDGLIAEYELRAKYNDSEYDYKVYSMLVEVRGIITEE